MFRCSLEDPHHSGPDMRQVIRETSSQKVSNRKITKQPYRAYNSPCFLLP